MVTPELTAAVGYLYDKHNLGRTVDAAYADGTEFGALEIAVHELSHYRTIFQLDQPLGKFATMEVGDHFESLRNRKKYEESDKLEFDALIVECLAFDMLGVELEHDLLFQFASGVLWNYRLLDLERFVIGGVSDEKYLPIAEQVVRDLYQAYETTRC
jgi:hypothetical protein